MTRLIKGLGLTWKSRREQNLAIGLLLFVGLCAIASLFFS